MSPRSCTVPLVPNPNFYVRNCDECGQTHDLRKDCPPMTIDPTEAVRRHMVESGQTHVDLAATTGQTWTTEQLRADFEVLGFHAPFVVVKRRSDGQRGSLEFTHQPRVYFNFQEES